MKWTTSLAIAAAGALCLGLATASHAAPLYSETFDADASASWTVNNNALGTNAADIFFDYSTVGIPSAPNSGGTTRGLKVGANLSSATAPPSPGISGISVSPNGQSFTGNYELRFDWWQNYFGPLLTGGTGSTMLSTYGIMTSGTSANFAGASDSVYFAATGETGSSSDFRIYSSQAPTSHTLADPAATYAAGTLNAAPATPSLYTTTFPGGIAAPALQQTNFPASQTGVTPAGGPGFAWHDVRIKKTGAVVTWTVDGVLLATINTAGFTTVPAGSNILFGSSDINSTTNTSANFAALSFTLIDNVRVVPEPGSAMLAAFGALGALAVGRRRK